MERLQREQLAQAAGDLAVAISRLETARMRLLIVAPIGGTAGRTASLGQHQIDDAIAALGPLIDNLKDVLGPDMALAAQDALEASFGL